MRIYFPSQWRKLTLVFLIVAMIVILLGTAGLFFFLNSLNTSSSKIVCNGFKKLYQDAKCGYYTTTTSGDHNYIIGAIESKTEENGRFYVNVLLSDSKKNTILEKIALAYPSSIQQGLTTITTDKSKISSIKSRFFNPKEVYDTLKNDQEILIDVHTFKNEDVNKAKKELGNLDYLRCNDVNASFITYLKNSSLKNKFSYLLQKHISRCHVVSLTLTQFQ